jgi:uncharacterized protein YggU (UPF0235/DUF167 family)
VRLLVRLTPRASADRIDGIISNADGPPTLKVSVAAPPAEGRANDALLQLLTREWRLPRRDLAFAAGTKSRNKTVHVAGEPTALLARLEPLLASLPRR